MKRILIVGAGFAGMWSALSAVRLIELQGVGQDEIKVTAVAPRASPVYGPGTWSAEPNGAAPLHVEAAGSAALLAVDHGWPGAYNIAEPGGALAIDKALSELGLRPDFRVSRQA